MSAPATSPHALYTQRLAARRAQVARLEAIDQRLAHARVAAAVAAALCWLLALPPQRLSLAWSAASLLVLVALVAVHPSRAERRRRAQAAAAFYESRLARLEQRFAGLGPDGARFLDPLHPYAADLDLFGPGSLYELLGGARTRVGEQTLAQWLLAPAPAAEVRARQATLTLWRERLDLREDLYVLGARAGLGPDASAIRAWAQAAPPVLPRGARLACGLAALANLAALLAYFEAGLPVEAMVAVWLSSALGASVLRTRVQAIVVAVEQPAQELATLARLLARLEAEALAEGPLRQRWQVLRTTGTPASREIARLGHLIDRLESRRNALFAPLAALLLWTTRTALQIEAWRRAHGPVLADWLTVLGEAEALLALAGLAFEQPSDPFPELLEEPGALFDGQGLAHPLLPVERAVRNDVRLDAGRALLVVSGSNMSGKSTLLRTIGVNCVLAWAGAPVRAERLRLSALTLGTSLRVHDSLQAGQSHFFAEIVRLRQLVDLARARPPLLFLLDEILHGTNSSDRRAGAEGLVRGLLALGALGLVTTHDLALARMVDDLGGRAENVHFEDHIEAERLVFDYRLRPGVVTRSNALALMRAVGLEV